MTTKTCAHCKYWTGPLQGGFRQCTIKSPRQTKSLYYSEGDYYVDRAIWPQTLGEESCGDWKGHPEEVLEEIDERFRRAQALHDEYEGLARGTAGSNAEGEIYQPQWFDFFWRRRG